MLSGTSTGSLDPTYDIGCDHEDDHDHLDDTAAIGDYGGFFGLPDVEVVRDYTALLKYYDSDRYRWNGQADVGTSAVVTYSFTAPQDLPALQDYNPYNASAYWSYNETQKGYFREAVQEYSDVSGVLFVEVQGEAMINAFGADVSSVGGWANYASSSLTTTGSGYMINGWSSMAPGQYGYQVLLHELGHALGMSHPHEGDHLQLADDVDTQENTVMTYNIKNDPAKGGWANDLGTFDIQAMQHLYGTAAQVDGWVADVKGAYVRIVASERSETILATGQDTLINGKRGDDLIYGREGDDKIRAGADNDTVHGGGGSDIIITGSGDDVAWGDFENNPNSGGNDLLWGSFGNDQLYGGAGDDTVNGGADADTVDGGIGNDIVNGFTGDDVVSGGDGHDMVYGHDGRDTIDGGSGNDTVDAGWQNDTVQGGAGDDKIYGGAGSDTLSGGTGNDTIFGGLDNDTMNGDAGDDAMRGCSGADLMNGGAGNDSLWGDGGNDTLIGGDGDDRMMGGAGADTFVFQSVDAYETNTVCDFENGIDTILIEGFGWNFASLDIASDGNGGAVVSYSNWFDLHLEGVAVNLLDSGDFTFT